MPDWIIPAAIVGFVCGSLGFVCGGMMRGAKVGDEIIEEFRAEVRARRDAGETP